MSGSDALKPVASGYLSGIGLGVEPHTDYDQNGLYECQSKKHRLYAEPFIFEKDMTLRIPVNSVELKGLTHSLERRSALMTTDGMILHIQCQPLTDPHE
ncbi:hypothetical protein C6502_07365 [Candidatus Poribacteria bacterium]|nr:MAG: hypothetical protein C6502_07365 [Candidatus Poribacteria bacterium]